MKPSKVLFLLILLSCAFLTYRASKSAEESKSETLSPTTTNKQGSAADSTSANAQKSPTPLAPGSIVANKPPSPKEENATKYESAYWPPIWSNWALFVAAVAAGIIALRTLRAIENQVRYNEIAADAARESAKLINESLHTDKPYLLVEDIRLTGINTPSELGIVAAWIVVANYGRGPAFIDEAIGTIRIVNCDVQARNYSECTKLGVPNVVRPGVTLPDSLMATLKGFSSTERERFLTGDDRQHLVVYGRIAYRDLMGGKYTEGFYWQADAFATRIRMGINSSAEPELKRGPKTHNYHESETGLS